MHGTGSSLRVHLALMALMVVWGLNISVVKQLTGMLDVMLVASVRMVLAAVALVVLLYCCRGRFPRWRGRTLLLGLLCAFLMVYANQVLFAAGMERTTATNGALIMALSPMISGLLEAMIFRKRLTVPYMAGVLLAFGGVALVILNRPGAGWSGVAAGDLLILASISSFACGGVIVQRLARNSSPLAIGGFLHVLGALLLTAHAGVTVDEALPALVALSGLGWGFCLFSGVLATAMGAVVWGRSIAALGIGQAAVYLAWIPVFGVGFAAWLLDEPLTYWHFIGVVAVLGGTLLSSARGAAETAPGRAAGKALDCTPGIVDGRGRSRPCS
ncbi:putative amino-acid metabolite efflux pump [compost metagenome]